MRRPKMVSTKPCSRTNALVEFLAEAPELLDMREELRTDLFLIRLGKSCNLRYGLFE